MNTTDWNGCYDGSWQSAPLIPEAYSHPAKVSFNLAERIYRHMLTEGWLRPGDAVLDPFGGIAGFAFHAALYGMHWTGVELEQKFVDLGGQNLELWRNRYAPHFPGYGSAVLLQGDSRRLVEVVAGVGGIVSSPPYSSGTLGDGDGPGGSGQRHGKESASEMAYRAGNVYGTTPGNLGNMPAGVVSSPPYAASVNQGDGANDADARVDRKADAGVDVTRAVNRGGPNSVLNRAQSYGTAPGQLGAMPAGVVSSPPFGTGDSASAQSLEGRTDKSANWIRGNTGWNTGYGSTPGNIGNDTAGTFWSAAAVIVQQCHAILRPGGYAAWVTGDFVRNKQRVPFGQQWLDLCIACGFEPVLWAVAWKSEHNGAQLGIFGNARELRKEKVSFFRRLANQKNPDAAVANEDVIFVRKPS